jgi:hypothetical protein
MSALCVMLALAQVPSTSIADPSVQSLRARVASTVDGGALQVICVNGTCSSSGGSSGDGGYTIVIQGPGADGGAAWGITGTVTIAQLPIAFLQDAGVLNVNPVGIAGQVGVNITDAGAPLNVQGPLTDAQLRASAVPISAAALPLPSGAATDSTLSQLLDGGVLVRGLAPNGQALPVAIDSSGAQYVRPVTAVNPYPLNPFLPRCNPVRRTGCQP